MLTIKKLYKDKRNGRLYSFIGKAGFIHEMDSQGQIKHIYKSRNPKNYSIVYIVVNSRYDWNIVELPTKKMAEKFISEFNNLINNYTIKGTK